MLTSHHRSFLSTFSSCVMNQAFLLLLLYWVHQKGSLQMGIELVYFLETLVCLLLSDQLLVLCYICLRLLSYSIGFFFFFLELCGWARWCHADQPSRLPWLCMCEGELINRVKEWYEPSDGNSLGNILDHPRDQTNAMPSTWEQMTTCRSTSGDGIRQASVKQACDVVKGNLKVWRWLPRQWNWRILRQRGAALSGGCHQGLALSFPHHTTRDGTEETRLGW